MTTIAFKDGILAADSRSTSNYYDRVHRCQKLFRKTTKDGAEVIIATAGENAPGLVFVEWYGSGKKPPLKLLDGDADFCCLVLTKKGLFEFDKWCHGEEVMDPFYAVGCGATAALGAMHAGATAEQAVEIACRIDPFTGPPVVTEAL